MTLNNASPERGIRPQPAQEGHARRSEGEFTSLSGPDRLLRSHRPFWKQDSTPVSAQNCYIFLPSLHETPHSWIELSLQPSSSSLSSVGTTDEIVTTGLRVQQLRRRRAPHHHHHHHGGYHVPPQDLEIGYSHRASSTTGSSQDENEETESESDQISNDDFPARLQPDVNMLPEMSSQSDETLSSDDEDDTSTALGFNPQPNAFSHPPASIRTTQPRNSFDSAARLLHSRSGTRRNSLHSIGSRRSTNQQPQHSPFNIISPSYQADHDAALRASLSTLLSCAAAARGLPKNDSQPSVADRSPPRAEPSTFRLLPGAADTEYEPSAEPIRAPAPPPLLRSPTSPSPRRSRSPVAGSQKARRRANPSKDRAAAKKTGQHTATETSSAISPTVMTWVISAGVVVLFSAISFSAGYILGREVGRVESGQGLYGNGLGNVSEPATSSFASLKPGAGCGREAVQGGLGRFRWTGGSISA
ncbi:hypothetical protein MferCBS49748_001337 [Microsporum ferrugineum]